jgi:hypothetical protein
MPAQEDVARDAAELVKRTTKAQGLPEKITDRAVLRRVAALVASTPGEAGPDV